MGTIGTWGNLSFVVSASKLLTFTDLQRKTAYRTESVDNEKEKPGTARISPELETIGFNILLARGLGVDPQTEGDAWRAACEAGQINPLYIGGVRRGPNNFLVQSVSESKCMFDQNGKLLSCTLAIAMQEYLKEMERKTESYESYSGGSGGSSGGSRTVKKSTTTSATTKKVVGIATANRSASIARMYSTKK